MLVQSFCVSATAQQKEFQDSAEVMSLNHRVGSSSQSSDVNAYCKPVSTLPSVAGQSSELEQLSHSLQSQGRLDQTWGRANRATLPLSQQVSSDLQRLHPASKGAVQLVGSAPQSQAKLLIASANLPNDSAATHPIAERSAQIATANADRLKTPQGYVAISPGVYVPQSYLASASISPSPSSLGFSSSPGFSSAVSPARSPLEDANSLLDTSDALTNSGIEFPRYPLLSIVPTTSAYGMRWGRLHAGVDLGTQIGTPVVASLSGQVIFQGEFGGYGKAVVLLHQNGSVETLYGHLSEILVRNGQSVRQGEVIAQSGNTGRSTGPHLHFEMRQQVNGRWNAININQIVARSAQLLRSGQAVAATSPASTSPQRISSPSPLVEMRVLLEKNAPSVQIAASTPAAITSMDGRLMASLPALRNWSVQSTASGLYVNGKRMLSAVFVQPQAGGLVLVNNRWYRGRVLLVNRPSGLLAVNWVDLEHYTASVVGSESYPSWHANALKAQAIAARSYALTFRYRPASVWYDLEAGPQNQAYNGVSAEFNTTVRASAETRGLVLTSNGGVVEAQYAATQALTDTYHNGFGMSQWGAAALADRGHNYQAILQKYYPGTSLSRISGS